MKHIIHTNNENYVIGLELSTSKEAVIVPEEVFNSQNLTCYKYENGEFTFDDSKKAEQDQRIANEQELADLKKHLADTDYAVIKIAEGVATLEDYAEVISQRQEWRARVNELE